MRLSTRCGRTAAFAVASAVVAGTALAQAQGGGQQEGQQGRRDPQAGNQRQGGVKADRPDAARQALIGHALSMAIESSGLMAAAQQGSYSRAYGPSGTPGAGTGRGTGSGTGGASGSGLGTGAGDRGGTGSGAGGATGAGTEGTSGAGTSAGSGTGTSGSRTTGLAGQESYASGNRPQTPSRLDPYTAGGSAAGGTPSSTARQPGANNAAGSGAQDAGTTGRAGAQATDPGLGGENVSAVRAGSPGMVTYVHSQLQQHAQRGFAESDRLFAEAARGAGDRNSPTERYLQAANNYASTLQSVAGFAGSRNDGGGAGQVDARGAAGAGASGAGTISGGMTSASDLQSVAMVNHAVKEVLDSCKIKKMCRMMGEGAEGTDVLRQHAQQMHDEGMRSIQALASTADTGAEQNRGAAGASRPAGSGDNLLDATTAGSRDRQGDRAAGTLSGSDSGAAADNRATTDRSAGAAGTRGSVAGGRGTTDTGTAVTGDAGGSAIAAGAQRTGPGTEAGRGTAAGGAQGAGVGSRGTGAAGMDGRGQVMTTLAQQAQELVRIIDELEKSDQ